MRATLECSVVFALNSKLIHSTNSRNAILRIGAKEEGSSASMITHDGRYRHSVYFSVIDSECRM